MKLRGADRDKHKVRPTVDMTPLIDVVFQLIIFFMLSATFIIQSSIHVEIPEAPGSTTLEQRNVAVTLAYDENSPQGDGRIFVDAEEMQDMVELEQRIRQEIRANPDVTVVVRTDRRVPSGRLLYVVGLAGELGLGDRLSIAVQAPEGES